MKLLGGALGVLLLAGGAVLLVHWSRPRVVLEGPAAELPRRSLDQVDHAPFDALLRRYVDGEGLVAYGAWKANAADLKALQEYRAGLGAVHLAQPAARSAQLAFWINLYNALTIEGILREYPTSSIRNHTAPVGGYNLWTDLLTTVDGKPHSLDAIEHQVLRGALGEPRIHFALVCAAKGCPPLRNEAYTTARVEEQLHDNARRFFARPANFQADAGSRTVQLSELLDWYGSDFGPTPAEQLKALRPYFPGSAKLGWVEEDGVTLRFLEYDWALNDQGK